MSKGISIAKFNENDFNEDNIFVSDECIAIADGAGGCGLFADEWSGYLVRRLPKDKPITTFNELDSWVDDIWETFYNAHEEKAKQGDAMLLNKFYKEGSCATIAAAWRVAPAMCKWMSYGDSVVFHYSRKTGILEHSFTRLADFIESPSLVSCKDPLEQKGFHSGCFHLDDTSIVFAASDALSHYILMMYEVSREKDFSDELNEERMKMSSNSRFLQMAEILKFNFFTDVMITLEKAVISEDDFRSFVKRIHAHGLLDLDDYSLVFLKFDIESCGSILQSKNLLCCK
jgi:hypothetical protein